MRVPERETTPTEPGLWIRAGMMPIFTLADGRMTPGQFGPMSRTPGSFERKSFALIMSFTGIPSVIATTSAIPAAAASMMPSAAAGGGTKTIDAFAPVAFTACSTVSNTGIPSTVVPPLPGVTPATTLVP